MHQQDSNVFSVRFFRNALLLLDAILIIILITTITLQPDLRQQTRQTFTSAWQQRTLLFTNTRFSPVKRMAGISGAGLPSAAASTRAVETVRVRFLSDPEALVWRDDTLLGVTPLEVTLPKHTRLKYRLTGNQQSSTRYFPVLGELVANQDETVYTHLQTDQQSHLYTSRSSCATDTQGLSVSNWRVTKPADSPFVVAEGVVTNTASTTLPNLRAVVTYSDATGTPVASSSTPLANNLLLPEQHVSFKLYTSYPVTPEHVSLHFESHTLSLIHI